MVERVVIERTHTCNGRECSSNHVSQGLGKTAFKNAHQLAQGISWKQSEAIFTGSKSLQANARRQSSDLATLMYRMYAAALLPTVYCSRATLGPCFNLTTHTILPGGHM